MTSRITVLNIDLVNMWTWRNSHTEFIYKL